ncbi:MAG: hypothetical protein E7323_03290 [Clostridiales bacterium]|nr:hypothetical protein [Clostridiales bacterium]
MLLEFLRPGENFAGLCHATRLMEDLQLSSCECLGLVAMIESLYGRVFGWEAELRTLGDLLAYLANEGVEIPV